jgi:hypothetical protein
VTTKIALVGAPGSGKTELGVWLTGAEKYAWSGPFFKRAIFLDGYVERLRTRTDLELSHMAGYTGNFMIAFERLALETGIMNNYKPEYLFTAGTLLDTLCYAQLHGAHAPTQTGELARLQTAMNALGMFMTDTFDYNIVFRLHRKQRDDFPSWDNALDDIYPQALDMFFISYHDIPVDWPIEQQVTYVRETVDSWKRGQDGTQDGRDQSDSVEEGTPDSI